MGVKSAIDQSLANLRRFLVERVSININYAHPDNYNYFSPCCANLMNPLSFQKTPWNIMTMQQENLRCYSVCFHQSIFRWIKLNSDISLSTVFSQNIRPNNSASSCSNESNNFWVYKLSALGVSGPIKNTNARQKSARDYYRSITSYISQVQIINQPAVSSHEISQPAKFKKMCKLKLVVTTKTRRVVLKLSIVQI